MRATAGLNVAAGEGVASGVGVANVTAVAGVGAAEEKGAGAVNAFATGTEFAGADALVAAGALFACAAGVGNAAAGPEPLCELDALTGAPGEPGIAGSLYDALPNVEVNGDDPKTGRSATLCALRTSPRTSIVVSRFGQVGDAAGLALVVRGRSC